jgi:hypothetical protein
MAATVMPASPSQRTSNSVDKIDGLLEKLQLKRQQSEPPVLAAATAAPPAKAINWADDDLDESFEVPEAWAKELSTIQPSVTPSRPVTQTAQRQTPAPPVTVRELFPASTPSVPPRTATPDRDTPRERRKADAKETAAFSRLAKGFLGAQPAAPSPTPKRRDGSKRQDRKVEVTPSKPAKERSLLERLEPRDTAFLNDPSSASEEEEPAPVQPAPVKRDPPRQQQRSSLVKSQPPTRVQAQVKLPPTNSKPAASSTPAPAPSTPLPKTEEKARPASGLSTSRWAH